jgi:general nucleoside transport system permease protein
MTGSSALLLSGITAATPLVLAGVGEAVGESAGVLNIAVEGQMLAGAFAAFAVGGATGSPALGCAAGAAAGALVALLFSAAAFLRHSDEIVVGTAVNLVVLGATGIFARSAWASAAPAAPHLPSLVGGLSALDLAALALAPATALFLRRTSWGIRLRAVGGSPQDARALGIPARRVRTGAAAANGVLSGLAGASLTLELADTFVEGMSAGRGFLALALVAFGRWNPLAVAAGALGFGLLQAFQFRLQARAALALPPQALLLLPYVFALAALGLRRRGGLAPASLGRGEAAAED